MPSRPSGPPTVVTGTIFAGNSNNPAPGQLDFTSDQVWQVDNSTVSGVMTTDGKLFTIDLDTLGAAHRDLSVSCLRHFRRHLT